MRSDMSKAVQIVTTSLFLAAAATGSALGATFSVGGTLSGLNKGATVILVNEGADALTLKTDGSFSFSTKSATGAAYDVTVHTQPKGQLCTVANPSGKVAKANVTNIKVTCVDAYMIGGDITGLDAKVPLTLLDNGGDALRFVLLTSTTKPVPFTFKTPVASGDKYDVTVGTPPTGQVCTIAKASGTVGKANVTNVAVTCVQGYTVSGSVTGLENGKSLTLFDDGGNAVTIKGTTSGKANFTFTDALPNKASYDVTIDTQPVGENCTIADGKGTIAVKNVTSVAVTCKVNAVTVGGTIDGLKKSAKLVLEDNSTNPLTIIGSGTGSQKFTFTAGLASGSNYDVTVETQPAGELCTVAKGTGKVGTSDVTDVVVTCVTGFTVGGTITGVKTGLKITIENNGGNATTLNGTATGTVAFTFSADLLNNATYDVSVSVPPSGESCVVSKGSGKIPGANVADVSIACKPSTVTTFSISGTVSGLTSTASSVTLKNGTATQTVTYPGTSFSFTGIASGSSYAVTVVTPPTGETCTVSANGSGVSITANITGVVVTCTASGSGGGGSFWIPYSAKPIPNTNGGSLGLFVIPSNKISTMTAPTPATAQWIVQNEATQLLALGVNYTVNNNVLSFSPQFMMYAATTSGGTPVTQIYGLTLDDTSSVPVPTQIGDLALPSTQQICNWFQSQTSLSDPTTVFVILEIASASGGAFACVEGPFTYEVVNYTDSASRAPGTLPINPGIDGIFSLYNDGSLVGLYLFEPPGVSGTLEANSVPWTNFGGVNSSYNYSQTTQPGTGSVGNPFIIPLPTGSQSVTLTISGTATVNGATHGPGDAAPTGSAYPAQFASSGVVVIGAFTDSSGNVLTSGATPVIAVGSGGTFLVPTGAAQLQLGIDSQNSGFPSNSGSFSVSGSVTGTGSVNLYTYDAASSSLSSPTALLTDEAGFLPLTTAQLGGGTTFGAEAAYFTATTPGTTENPEGTTTLYRIASSDPTAAPAPVHQGNIGSYVTDQNNLYFADVTSTTTTDLYQVALAGGTPTELFTGPATVTTGGDTYNIEYQLIGTNESLLAFETSTYSGTTTGTTANLYTLQVGKELGSATLLAGPFNNQILSAFLAAATAGDATTNVLFADLVDNTYNNEGEVTSETESSFSMALDATSAPAPTAKSVYEPLGIGDASNISVWQATGITDTSGGWGGGTANVVDVGTLADTPLTTTGGSNYQFAAGYVGALDVGLTGDNAGVGIISPSFLTNPALAATEPVIGAALDLTKDYILTIDWANTDIGPY